MSRKLLPWFNCVWSDKYQPCRPSRSAFLGGITIWEAESMELIEAVFLQYCEGTNFGAID